MSGNIPIGKVQRHKINYTLSIKRKIDEKEILYILQDRSGIKASGKPISEGFAVLKGSKVANNVATSLSKAVIDKRQVLFGGCN